MAGPPTMLARFVATVPFKVGTQLFDPFETPPSGVQLDVKHAFVAAGASRQAPVALHVPPHAPAEQAVPAAATGLEHPPVPPSPGVQVPAVWHESDGLHVTGLPPTQVPL